MFYKLEVFDILSSSVLQCEHSLLTMDTLQRRMYICFGGGVLSYLLERGSRFFTKSPSFYLGFNSKCPIQYIAGITKLFQLNSNLLNITARALNWNKNKHIKKFVLPPFRSFRLRMKRRMCR